MYHPFHPKDIGWKFESNIIFQIGASNTEIRYIETQLVGKPIQFRTLQYNNFSLQELFPLKKNWIQLQVKKKQLKKKNKKTAHMESITVMLINSVLMTTLIPLYDDINSTFTACGAFWTLKKYWYFTHNHITVIITIYRECYDIKRNVGIAYFFATSSFVSKFVCFREIFAGFDIDESYNYIQHVI